MLTPDCFALFLRTLQLLFGLAASPFPRLSLHFIPPNVIYGTNTHLYQSNSHLMFFFLILATLFCLNRCVPVTFKVKNGRRTCRGMRRPTQPATQEGQEFSGDLRSESRGHIILRTCLFFLPWHMNVGTAEKVCKTDSELRLSRILRLLHLDSPRSQPEN